MSLRDDKIRELIIQKREIENDKKESAHDFNIQIKDLDDRIYGLATAPDDQPDLFYETYGKKTEDADYEEVPQIESGKTAGDLDLEAARTMKEITEGENGGE